MATTRTGATSRVRLEVPHDRAASGRHEFVFLPGWRGEPITVRRDIRGRKHAHAWRDWIVLICNNTGCPGRAIIDASVLTDIATSELAEVSA